MTEQPSSQASRHLSDGNLATDPWPGIDLHPIRSTPEDSSIGGLAGGGEEPCVDRERKRETKEEEARAEIPSKDKNMGAQRYCRLVLQETLEWSDPQYLFSHNWNLFKVVC